MSLNLTLTAKVVRFTVQPQNVVQFTVAPVAVPSFPITISPVIMQVVGPEGGTQDRIQAVADTPISGGRLVRKTPTGVSYYDSDDTTDAYTLLGVALNGANTGDVVTVQTGGTVEHIGWGLTAGVIYTAGTSGALVPATNGSSFTQIIGRALGSNTLIFSPQQIIFPN